MCLCIWLISKMYRNGTHLIYTCARPTDRPMQQAFTISGLAFSHTFSQREMPTSTLITHFCADISQTNALKQHFKCIKSYCLRVLPKVFSQLCSISCTNLTRKEHTHEIESNCTEFLQFTCGLWFIFHFHSCDIRETRVSE